MAWGDAEQSATNCEDWCGSVCQIKLIPQKLQSWGYSVVKAA